MRNKLLKQSILSILLLSLMTSLSWSAYAQNLTLPAENDLEVPPLDLEIPKPLEITQQGITMFVFSIEGYGTILKVFTGYQLWAENYTTQQELEATTNERLETCQLRLINKDKTIQLLEKDRDHAYDLFNQELNDQAKISRRNKLKVVLVSSGTGLVGLIAGLIIRSVVK